MLSGKQKTEEIIAEKEKKKRSVLQISVSPYVAIERKEIQ